MLTMRMRSRVVAGVAASVFGVMMFIWTQLPGKQPQDMLDEVYREDDYISMDDIAANISQKYLQLKDNLHETFTKSTTESHDMSSVYKNKILIFTSYRTGSTFTGELFRQNRNIFYLFEPLKLPTLISRDTYLQERIVDYIDDCFNCRFGRLIEDSEKLYPLETKRRKFWITKIFNQTLERHGQLSIPELDEVCSGYSIHAIKIIRGNRIQDMFPLLQKGLKLIHLVRDPRGTITSRLQIESVKSKQPLDVYWKNVNNYLPSAQSECQRYVNTFNMLQGQKNFSHDQESLLETQYRLVRYEDIAYNPEHIALELYKFVGIKMPLEVSEWITKSTSQTVFRANTPKGLSEAYSTSRNSSATAEAWRTKMPFTVNLEIQRVCTDMLRKFGYRRVYSRTEYRDLSMSLVRKSLVREKFQVL